MNYSTGLWHSRIRDKMSLLVLCHQPSSVWYFQGISPRTPANQAWQCSPDIRPQQWLPWGAVRANSPDKANWICMEISWERKFPGQISLPTPLTLTGYGDITPTSQETGNNETTTPEANMHPPGQRKPCKEQLLLQYFLVFLTELLLQESRLYPQELNTLKASFPNPAMFRAVNGPGLDKLEVVFQSMGEVPLKQCWPYENGNNIIQRSYYPRISWRYQRNTN